MIKACKCVPGGGKDCFALNRFKIFASGREPIGRINHYRAMLKNDLRLILIYNADSGLLNMAKDALHKIIRPQTYPCSLCALTYGPVMMRGAWRRFITGLPFAKTFHHRDDFAAAFPAFIVALPAILIEFPGQPPEVLISAHELDALPDLAALIALVTRRLDAAA